MSDKYPYPNPATNPATSIIELRPSSSSPSTNDSEAINSNLLLHGTPASTYIGLPEVPNFSTFVQASPNVHDEFEQFTTNVVSQPQQRRMEVGESSRPRTSRRRIEFDQKEEEGNLTRSQDTSIQMQRNRMHSESERKRRERIRERIRTLKELVPECDKNATAEVIGAATNHIRGLQSHLRFISMGSLLQSFQMGSYYGMGWSPPAPPAPPAPPPQGLPIIPHQPALSSCNLPPPQAEAALMASMFQQAIYRAPYGMVPSPPQPPMPFNPPGILSVPPPPQPSTFVSRALPPPVYTSVAPSVYVPPNFPTSTNTNQAGLNQRNPDDADDDDDPDDDNNDEHL